MGKTLALERFWGQILNYNPKRGNCRGGNRKEGRANIWISRGGKAADGEHLSKREICTRMAICTVSKNLQHPWYLCLHKGSKHKSVDWNHTYSQFWNLYCVHIWCMISTWKWPAAKSVPITRRWHKGGASNNYGHVQPYHVCTSMATNRFRYSSHQIPLVPICELIIQIISLTTPPSTWCNGSLVHSFKIAFSRDCPTWLQQSMEATHGIGEVRPTQQLFSNKLYAHLFHVSVRVPCIHRRLWTVVYKDIPQDKFHS
jgi:hypothetical protein